MARPLLSRLLESLNSELNENAIASERRLDAAGLPIRDGAEWTPRRRNCKALWSCRHVAEKTLAHIQEHRDGIGTVQWFCCANVDNVPFQWV